MRDIVVTLIVFGLLPVVLRKPYVGILLWSWIGYMNPHKLGWGFASTMPFAQITAIVLFASLLISKEPKRIPWTPVTILWVIFILWMFVTTAFALFPDEAVPQLIKILKIQLVTFLTMMLMTSKERINLLIWVIVVSIGYYSVKGGAFTLLTGGAFRVWGPSGSFIEENNSLALTTLMVIPLMQYLRTIVEQKWAKRMLLGAMALSAISAIGSQSRGALLAMLAVAGFFWLKSRHKMGVGLAILLFLPLLFLFMPESWHERMSTIQTYEQDSSAMERINSWGYAINVASARLTGGGLESWHPSSFALYAPDPTLVYVAHSIYFSVIGDHGWIGFILYASILIMTWRSASWIIRVSREREEFAWSGELARMMQVGLVAYLTGGAFLSLSYFDLPWHYVAIIVLVKEIVKAQIEPGTEKWGNKLSTAT